MSDTPEPLLNVAQVAALLNVPKSWVYANSETGTLPSRKIGKYRRFVRAEILHWLEGQQPRAGAKVRAI